MTDELISRQAAIDAVLKISEDETAVHNGWVDPYYVMEMLKRLPSAQPDRKKGKWIELEPKGVWTSVYHCSECGGAVMSCKVDLPKYCGHCGARMEGIDETY